MDPSHFRIDWEVLSAVLVPIVVIVFFIECAKSIDFTHHFFVEHLGQTGLKERVSESEGR